MTERRRQPIWNRKRWLAVAMLWLAMAYPISLWPASYLAGARLVDESIIAVYRPLAFVMISRDQPRFGFGWYFDAGEYFYKLGGRLRYDFVDE